MSNESSTRPSAPVFRIDKFVVPAVALPTFMQQVQRTQQALGALPGCQQNLVLTQTGGGSEFNVATVVEWASAQAMAAAQGVMKEKYAQEDFDPASFMRRLGVRADLGLYGMA